MIIAVQGTNAFDNYSAFLRAMAVGMSMLPEDDKDILVYSVGPRRVNGYVTEFCNITERSLKSRGIKIRYRKVPISLLEQDLKQIDYFVFLSKPGENTSRLLAEAELEGVEAGIFRF